LHVIRIFGNWSTADAYIQAASKYLIIAAMTSHHSTVGLINWGARTPEGAEEG